MTESLLGVISFIFGVFLFLIGIDRKTLWELKNEDWNRKFNIYQYLISALALIIVGVYLFLK